MKPLPLHVCFFPMSQMHESPLLSVPDGGPVYRETGDLSNLIVEPWNAFSSLTFLIPAIWFLWELRGKYRQFAFLVFFCAPMLITGGLGSTLYHAFRHSPWLLAMDVFPILALVLGISIFMWLKVLKKAWYIIPVLTVYAGLTALSGYLPHIQDRISAGYFIRGWMLFLPCYLYLRKTRFYGANLLFTALGFFLLALLFRVADEKIHLEWMPWGTHWLWHVSTAVGGWFLGLYLIRAENKKEGEKFLKQKAGDLVP